MSTVISVENVTKTYRLGQIGGGTLKGDVSRWWAKLQGKPDPLLKVGQEHHARKMGEVFWALQDVSFQVKEGEVLGIIGRNGAGKSTLLKILSQVTMPTSGRIKIKGRIASLLEVGTGFHPELTGRENIFLNGAILGMTKAEIRKKFDEIVAFSGIEEFIDTPVKRYSSGMYVRLAFAVAAHLEPEILIVDEVLAVGDAEFQKKCMGKMQDVSKGGRTILFVSHNMQAISQLCTSAILIKNGRLALHSDISEVVGEYLLSSASNKAEATWTFENAPGTNIAKLCAVHALNERNEVCNSFDLSNPITLKAKFWIITKSKMTVSFHLYNHQGITAFATANLHDPIWGSYEYESGFYSCWCTIPGNLLNEGDYFVTIVLTRDNNATIIEAALPEVISFNMRDAGTNRGGFNGNWLGVVRPLLPWAGEKTGCL